jgi:hypothetical protein
MLGDDGGRIECRIRTITAGRILGRRPGPTSSNRYGYRTSKSGNVNRLAIFGAAGAVTAAGAR